MSISYFTIIHILVLCVIFVLFILFFVLSFKAEKKLFWSLLFTNILACSVTAGFLMPILDKYTKKGVLQNVKHHRILINETIVFNGEVKNIGKFQISKCNFGVKIVNQALNTHNVSGNSFFKSSGASLFSWFFDSNDGNEKPNTVEYSFSVAKDLKPKKIASFSVSMPFPPYFSKSMIINKLNCY
ncbi:putative DUF2393 domain protein [Campylobacter pinnipediorum subsp. pinnipediorum]|uniref:DUF2393 domain protein n=1 Tax=Campylobacter pinnipediorum subsp. pinnipediorum TaxID=1660067 RepID=A0AAX0L9I7_9BACT|nr:DUF2393 family protein [Campylobacter pinnipediorum]AQW81910.1 putative DUF2393 domain protein [Campylobacter pinnipediorum subsp. pinnipediorum]AQW85107.1 putative DUF2393 domain protein [Campylobacter pinnipediorum subsp. pinnipediorum]OPA75921.1 hypothetical protein BFG04_05635 [Campylobacter pinnipediorum subsp. pinnipediorum]